CGTGAAPTLEPLVAASCDVVLGRDDAADDAAFADVESALDLETTRCPLNLLRVREALDALAPGARLVVRLGEEGAQTVPGGVLAAGHRVVARRPRGHGLDLVVEAVGERAAIGEPLDLERYARQIVLEDVGVAGQRRLLASRVAV